MDNLVSIIIPTHNREDVIARAIKSALNQSYPSIEVIVVNDHSTDNTCVVVQKLLRDFPNLTYFELPNQLSGACEARNFGIQHANGLYIAGLDDDDEFDRDRIKIMLPFFKKEYAFVCSAYTFCRDGKLGNTYRFSRSKQEIMKNDLLWCNLVGNQVLVLKEDIQAIGGFDVNMPCNQDWDMWLRLLDLKAKAYYIPDSLQMVYVDKNKPSITKLANRKNGLELLYDKNQIFMSFWQKQFYYFRKYRNYNSSLSVLMVLSCFFFGCYRIKVYLKNSIKL